MKTYQKILVVIDPSTDEQKALQRAIDLAANIKASGGQVEITAFLSIFDFSYEMTTILSNDDRGAMRQSVIKDKELWLEGIISDLKPDIDISNLVVWHNRPFESIIEQVIQNNYDLVIKGTHQHDRFKSVIFTPTDWHILRKCPCPVLLVKEHEWPSNGNILAAINVGSDETEHNSLNNKITKEAKNLAQLIQGNVHLVNSFPGTPVNIAIEIPEFNSSEYNNTMLQHHKKSMAAHATEFEIDITNTHVEEGLPERVIEEVADKIDAELVVLGTIGRTGISAALIGNTAEHVIDQLNCDVLALKPEGYVSPLQ
ncbi:universal stress protein UspE [Colwellia sp. 4_MG-2023]|jgi:universal stress protein E|uniref:universal stress protein UspE n=1 Tax=unclassified Colwellia TaxID=196834 RepID=UPI001C09F906|nr:MULTISPECIES: universal stress protein UspE [unclassified Colwellia]MBU2924318.1 universal stress protein UspE [Colwellia sp. C2M11]MDO6505459.1 universal stress protein UspE [Colwellia sp. 5_MG-2023]MDO6554245.1 universal stress protein UspE [Colwellia sp. 4_MG-2023]MDO6650880.1 universal stress protein UspE [Colwellia sp. 3_MG-2023]MDO6663915.1 universal stress protein UspE [Colwellia sp. 2_MG-2023]